MLSLEEIIKTFHLQYGVNKTIWIAYSGGLDSHVLLHLYYRLNLSLPISIRVLHINHGLHQVSASWATHCRTTCQAYNLYYYEKSLQIKLNPGQSLEEVAREQRYATFKSHMSEGDLLITAHHQDDQVETMFIQLMRGAGLKGLAAMPSIKPFHHAYHARPLLQISKERLKQYAIYHQLHYINDSSNDNIQLTRNFIRHQLLPVLKKRWPTVSTTVNRSIEHLTEAHVLLEEFALSTLARVEGSVANTLSIKKLLQLSPAKQRLILRTWIHSLGYLLPNTNKIHAIQETVLTAASDRMPLVTWQQVMIRRYQDDLYVTTILPTTHHSSINHVWDITQPFKIEGIGILYAKKVLGKGLHPDIKQISIRFRQGGETFTIPGRGKCSLKNLFQEWHIPPWLRARIPLIFFNEQLIGLIGYTFSRDYLVTEHEEGNELFLFPQGEIT